MLILIIKNMKKLKLSPDAQDWIWSILFAIALAMMVFFYTPRTHAQSVVRNGKVFVQQSSQKDSTDTGYVFQDIDGNKYPVFLSAKGKAYAWVKSKKTGKMYKRYLPKITQMLKDMDNGKYSK